MRVKTNLEYSIFQHENPFAQRHPYKTEEFSDKYFIFTPERTLKMRNGEELKFKELLRRDGQVDVWNNTMFHNAPHNDALSSFLEVNNLVTILNEKGIVVVKKRLAYRTETTTIHYCEFLLENERGTNLTVSARDAEHIMREIEKLGIKQRNKSFGEYIAEHVARQNQRTVRSKETGDSVQNRSWASPAY
ncbi:hypothetical protein HY486_02280 [Candidatus Woesearchaeota archaeon]|nr:hypothetical protein [Candidatus Woesearchaeota archaeon]